MKSDERHHLERNALVEWLETASAWLQLRWKYIAGGLGTGIVLIIVNHFWRTATEQATHDAWTTYYAATKPELFESVVRQFPGSLAAKYARLRAADLLLLEAKQDLISDRTDALLKLDKIVGEYDALITDQLLPEAIRRQAAEGKAVALESQGLLEKAKAAYLEIANLYSGENAALKSWAEARAKQMESREAHQFYAMLEKYEPPTPSVDLPQSKNNAAPALPPLDDLPPPKLESNAKKAGEDKVGEAGKTKQVAKDTAPLEKQAKGSAKASPAKGASTDKPKPSTGNSSDQTKPEPANPKVKEPARKDQSSAAKPSAAKTP